MGRSPPGGASTWPCRPTLCARCHPGPPAPCFAGDGKARASSARRERWPWEGGTGSHTRRDLMDAPFPRGSAARDLRSGALGLEPPDTHRDALDHRVELHDLPDLGLPVGREPRTRARLLHLGVELRKRSLSTGSLKRSANEDPPRGPRDERMRRSRLRAFRSVLGHRSDRARPRPPANRPLPSSEDGGNESLHLRPCARVIDRCARGACDVF